MKFILFWFCINFCLFPQSQDHFIIGAENVSSMFMFANDQFLPAHSDIFWNKAQEFGLSYSGLKYFENHPVLVSDILDDIDFASQKGIYIFLNNGFDHNPNSVLPYYPQRWVYTRCNLI